MRETMKIRPIFRWFDFYVGGYWSQKDKILYLFYLPMCGLMISWQRCAGSCRRPIFAFDGDPYCIPSQCCDGDCVPF